MQPYIYFYKNDFYPTMNLEEYPEAIPLTESEYNLLISGQYSIVNGQLVESSTIQNNIDFSQYKSDRITAHSEWEVHKYQSGILVEVLPGEFDTFAAMPEDMTKVTSGCVYVMLMSQVSPETPLEVLTMSTGRVRRMLNGLQYINFAGNYGSAYNELRKYVNEKLEQIENATTVQELDNIILD
ncbi:hypothetical protein [Microcystis phage Mel-JY01]